MIGFKRYGSRSAKTGATGDDEESGRPVGVVQPTRAKSAPARSLHGVSTTRFNTQRSGISPVCIFITPYYAPARREGDNKRFLSVRTSACPSVAYIANNSRT